MGLIAKASHPARRSVTTAEPGFTTPGLPPLQRHRGHLGRPPRRGVRPGHVEVRLRGDDLQVQLRGLCRACRKRSARRSPPRERASESTTKGETACQPRPSARSITSPAAHVEPRLVAESAEAQHPAPALAPVRSMAALQLREEFRSLDLAAVKKDLRALMTDSQTGGRDFGHYGPCSSHGMAQRRHLPHRRRSRRRGPWQPTLRAPQQLADNVNLDRAPAAVADQAEVRPEDLLGRPHDLAATCAGVDGFKPSGSGAGARTSGSPSRTSPGVPRTSGSRTSVLRRPGARQPLAAVQMGLIYVNRRPNGNPDPIAARGHRETSPAWR